LAKINKFGKMLMSEDKKHSSFDVKVSKKIQKDVEKDLARREKERKAREKIQRELALQKQKLEQEQLAIKQQIATIELSENSRDLTDKLSRVELQLKNVDEKIKIEKQKEIAATLEAEILKEKLEAVRKEVQIAEAKQSKQKDSDRDSENKAEPVIKKVEKAEVELVKDEIETINPKKEKQEADSLEDSKNNSTGNKEEKSKTANNDNADKDVTTNKPEKEVELDEKETEEKLNQSEINELKKQIALEKGMISPDDLNQSQDTSQNLVKPKEEKLEENSSEQTQEDANQKINVDDRKYKHSKDKKTDGYAPPEESLPDNITDEELEQFMQENQSVPEEEEDEDDYSGMTESEIADFKERKKRLKELKARYNTKEVKSSDDMGDYRKNLDFTINTSIKRFKVKPPKKPFIIAFSILFALMAIAGVVAYFILNRPPEPIVISSIKLSQTTTYQYVGEEVDVRGMYIYCTYTDGSEKKIEATKDMISRTSTNINTNLKISTYSNSTYVYFKIDGFEAKLDITLTQISMEEISATIYNPNLTAGREVKFNDILILGTTNVGTLKLNSGTATYTIGTNQLQKTATGFIIPSEVSGEQTLTITCTYNNRPYSVNVSINVEELESL